MKNGLLVLKVGRPFKVDIQHLFRSPGYLAGTRPPYIPFTHSQAAGAHGLLADHRAGERGKPNPVYVYGSVYIHTAPEACHAQCYWHFR